KDEISTLRAASLLDKQLQVEVPQLLKESDVIEKEHVMLDASLQVDISKLVDKIKSEKAVYLTQLHILQEELKKERFDIFDLKNLSNKDWAMAVISWICFIVVIILCFKISRITSLVAVATNVVATKESRVTPMVLKFKKTIDIVETELSDIPEAGKSSNILMFKVDLEEVVSKLQIVFMIGITLIIIILLFCILKKLQRKYRPGTTVIWFHIFTAQKLVKVRVQELGDQVGSYEFKAKGNGGNIGVVCGIRPYISLDWKLEILHRISHQIVPFNNNIFISWTQFWKLKRMTGDSSYCAIPFLQIGTEYFVPIVLNRDAIRSERGNGRGNTYVKSKSLVRSKGELSLYPRV
ncbi:MAG: hypothetical protein WAX04_02315, partial [Oscillospiraceae bacterium]